MTDAERIYLDNAATSWPKPLSVYDIVDRYQRELGAPAGRGVYAQAIETERLINSCRQRVARLIGAADSSQIVFTLNGTDSLNLAIHGTLRAGDHVVTTTVEHNSVLRPLRFLEERGFATVTRLPCDGQGVVDPDAFVKAIQPNTRLLVLTHVSNVTGAIQPIAEVSRIARQRGLLMLVDAAQSLGHLEVDVTQIDADLVAAPGHKGLLGPLGTGLLYVGPRIQDQLQPIRMGGTGTASESDKQPATLPDRYESGNPNVPGILGLGAAVEFVAERTVNSIRQHEESLTKGLLAALTSIRGVTVHGPQDPQRQVGVVSLAIQGFEPQEAALTLDTARSIQVRAGFHCAPLMHRSLGTDKQGGSIRISAGPFNDPTQIDLTADAIAELALNS